MAKQASRRPIGQILKEMELVTEGGIQEALQVQRDKGGPLGQILIELGYVREEDVLFALAAQANMEVVELDRLEIPASTLAKMPASMAQMYQVIPISWDDKTKELTVALSDPSNVTMFHDLKFMLNCSEVHGKVTTPVQIQTALDRFYSEQGMQDVMADMENVAELKGDHEHIDGSGIVDLSNPEALANAAPVIKLLNLILMNAIRDKASDVHFEPYDEAFRVRYRVDGVLYEMPPPPKHLAAGIISRVKVMSNLDIAETRVPQDGRIELQIAGKPVDLRVSTLPTMFGESCVMRILDRSVVALDIENIGFRDAERDLVKALIQKPNGIILVTGPTGSGKTTTLYSCLNYANDPKIKIITTEDPVEYDLDGIVQVQINEEIGVTYAKCLRSILRQDPDKILVGEIRDLQTAQIAIEASLTGHLVFSTLHTNDAPSAITRLLDMDVENFLLAGTLEAVIAQRLVRRICGDCKTLYEPNDEHCLELGIKPDQVAGKKFARGSGCETCNYTGHRGRMAIFEIMMISDSIRELIMDQASTAAMRDMSRREGMRSLREAGLLGIYDQKTSIEEVLRETLMND